MRRLWGGFVLIALAGLACRADAGTADASARAAPTPSAAEKKLIDEAFKESAQALEPAGAAPAAAPELAAADKAYASAVAAYYQHLSSSYQNRTEAFAWHAASTKIIFAVVVALVLFGAVLTALQFTPKRNQETKLAFASSGIEVTSPVLGVIILAMSFAFFFLYVKYVYPIHEASQQAADPKQGAPGEASKPE